MNPGHSHYAHKHIGTRYEQIPVTIGTPTQSGSSGRISHKRGKAHVLRRPNRHRKRPLVPWPLVGRGQLVTSAITDLSRATTRGIRGQSLPAAYRVLAWPRGTWMAVYTEHIMKRIK